MNTSRLHLRFDASAALAHALARIAARGARSRRLDTAAEPAWLLIGAALAAVAVLMFALWLSDPGSARWS